jgi:hypothetical protein
MIEDGRAYGVALVVEAILQKLEQSGLLTRNQRHAMLDDVCDEIRDLAKREVLSPNASADASRIAGMMYHGQRPNAPARRLPMAALQSRAAWETGGCEFTNGTQPGVRFRKAASH